MCLQEHCHGEFGQNIIINEELSLVQEILLAPSAAKWKYEVNCRGETKLLLFLLYLCFDKNQQQFWKRLSASFFNFTSQSPACIPHFTTFIASLHSYSYLRNR